jgi:hypothetical protein
MIWTNVFGLPDPVANAVKNDPYAANVMDTLCEQAWRKFKIKPEDVRSGKVPNVSMTSLIKPVRVRALERRHDDKIVKDVSDNIWTLFGQGLHTALERGDPRARVATAFRDLWDALITRPVSGTPAPSMVKSALELVKAAVDTVLGMLPEGYTTEQRIVTLVDGVLVHGAFDLRKEGVLDDYKVVPIYQYEKAMAGDKPEWAQQLNGGRWLLASEGIEIKQLRIIALLKDWMSSMTKQSDYPQKNVQVVEFPLWPMPEIDAWMRERVKAHISAATMSDDELPECTPEEMWEKPEAWAVQRKGGLRAAKLHRVKGQEGYALATADAEARNKKLKKSEQPFEVIHRPGERTRCERFCAAAPFCEPFQAYKAAAWKDNPVPAQRTEDVTETAV